LSDSKREAAAAGTAKVEACDEQQLQQATEEHEQLVTQPPPGFVLSGLPQNHTPVGQNFAVELISMLGWSWNAVQCRNPTRVLFEVFSMLTL
jgi:hypothetical protein